uniref:EAL domain-containing protein n=2 Tax=Panagrellus redivivus TaxID=6233 RepID=A0A7E4VVI4_PANRE
MEELLPKSDLPLNFKKRTVALTPPDVLNSLSKIFTDITKHCPFRPDVYKSLYITDDLYDFDEACDSVFWNQLFYTLLYQFELIRYILDGHAFFLALHDAALNTFDIFDKKKNIYVKDTLVINCEQFRDYDKLIPLISGSYTKLVLSGSITWDQAKLLMHKGVKQIIIDAKLDISPTQYDEFAEFVLRRAHGFDFKFVYKHQESFGKTLEQKLDAACKQNVTFFIVLGVIYI